MVLTFVLVGLGVYVLVRLIEEIVTGPDWFFMALAIGLACLGCWWAGESAAWGPAAAGFAILWQRLEEIVAFIRDWVKVAAVTRVTRR